MPSTSQATQPPSSPPLIVLGTRGDGWSSVEAVGALDGLVRWAYEPRNQVLNDITCHAGTIFVAMREVPGLGLTADSDAARHRAISGPVQVVALRAWDGAEVWRMHPKRIAGRMARWRLWQAARVGFGEFSWHNVRWALEALRLTGFTWIGTDGVRVYVGKGAVLWAFEISSGRLLWLVSSPPGRRLVLLAAGGGRVFVEGGGYSGIQALDARTGRLRWRYPGASTNPLILGEERMYLDVSTKPTLQQSRRRALVTVQIADGVTLGQVPWDRDQEKVLAISNSGIAYLQRDQQLCAVRLDDAALLWRSARLDEDSPVQRSDRQPSRNFSQVWMAAGQNLLAYALVRFTGASRTLHIGALDPLTGATRWRWDAPESSLPLINGVVLLVLQDIVVVSVCAGVYALRGEDGQLLWHIPAALREPPHICALTGAPEMG